jgi:CheY-like chemotaxis protein
MEEKIILVVEDNEQDADLTLRALEKSTVADQKVVVVRNGLEAKSYLFGPHSIGGGRGSLGRLWCRRK